MVEKPFFTELIMFEMEWRELNPRRTPTNVRTALPTDLLSNIFIGLEVIYEPDQHFFIPYCHNG